MLSQALRSLRPVVSRLFVSKPRSLAVFSALVFAASLGAQTASSSAASFHAPADRLTQPIVESSRVVLAGTLHPLATKANDRGAVGDGMKLDRIQVVLKRSDAQESALKQLIGEMHQKGSANYHKWLTPEDFGKQFGPSDADVAKLESWLGSHGFSITKLNPGRQSLEIAGTAGQFHDTFHAQIHAYQVKAVAGGLETRYANASAPEIPAALAPVFGGFASLNNFRFKSQAKVLGKAQFNPATHESKPGWNYGTSSGYDLVVAPTDFAVQYDLNPLYNANTPIKGTGQSIAIVNESNIDIALVNNYRSLFGLPANPPQVIIDGNDPGVDGINSPYGANGASGEAYLDVEVSGAVAPNAQINLVIANDTALENGLTLAMGRAVYSNVSPILSLSFLGCELQQGSFNAFLSGLWEQAAAQGITVVVASGDNGSAGCDDFNSQEFAVRGQAVNGLASTPYDVAVGGTDFYYAGVKADIGTYWNLGNPNESTPTQSLAKKAPEQPFNSSQFGVNVFPESSSSGTSIFAASGGASTCGLATVNSAGTVTACAPYPKPSWQSGAGVPNDHARDLPDVSLFGSLSYNGSYTPICASDGDCQGGGSVQITGVGGTSVSAPEFAGMMALVNQVYGRQGQANYVLYPLATQFPAAFNDITNGTVTVPCATTSVTDSDTGASFPVTDCQTVTTGDYSITDNVYGNTVEGEIGLTAGTAAYNAGPNYDLASGLGSVDAYNMVTNWGSVTFAATSTALTYSAATSAITLGESVSISGKVTPASGSAVPTGTVSLLTSSTEPNNQGQAVFTLDSTGAFSGSISSLPGGTYNLTASYSGDGVYAPSTSAATSITIGAVASTPNFQAYMPVITSTSVGYATIASGSTIPYGTIVLSATPGPSTGTTTTKPTGTVEFLSGTSILGTSVVNKEGDSEYNPVLPPSSSPYSLTASYSGDASYNPSISSPVTVTVTKDSPVINIINVDNNVISVKGSIFTVLIENSVNFTGVPILAPSGTLALANAPAGTTSSATLTAGVDPSTGAPAGVAIFTVPANASTGNYTFAFTYSGDSNYSAQNFSAAETLYVYKPGGAASTTTATATATATSPTAAVQVTATVTGASGTPTGTVYLVAAGSLVGEGNLPSGSGSSVTTTIAVNSGSLLLNTNQITVQYEGDNTYYPSATTITIANPLSDFSLVPQTTIVSVPNSGVTPGVQTDTINLASYNGFAGSVALTCTASGGVTCSLGTSSATLASGGSASTTLTVNTGGVTKAGTYNVVVTGTDATGKYVHTIGLQVVTPLITVPSFTLSGTAVTIANAGGTGISTITATPATGFTGAIALTCAIAAGPAGATSSPTCSPSTLTVTAGAVTGPLTFNTTTTTTPGTYTVTVTGTAGSVAPTTTVLVTVAGGAAPGTFSLSNSAAITVATLGGTGTSTISVTPGTTNPYTGSVALTCSVTGSPSGAINLPTCSLSPASVTLAGAALTSTLTINTTAQTSKLDLPLKGIFTASGGVALAALLFFGVPVGRRGKRTLQVIRTLRILSVALLFAMIAGAGIGCGSGSSSGGTPPPAGGTTTGAYTVTVTGTPISGTAQTVAVAVTVN